MSAAGLPRRRLRPTGRFGGAWVEFLVWADKHVDASVDPWRLYPFAAEGAAALPDLSGPVVYAAVGADGTCRYVGKSLAVRDRFRAHTKGTHRKARWTFVVVCPLVGLPEGGLDRAEHMAARILRPVEGDRHPRLR